MKSITLIILCYLNLLNICPQYLSASKIENYQHDFKSADSLFKYHPDSSFNFYEDIYVKCCEVNDTVGQIKCLQRMGKIRYKNMNLVEALNFETEALYLSERINDLPKIASSLAGFGKIHCKFGLLTEGEEYLRESHNIRLKCIKENKIGQSALVYSYLNLAELENQKKNYSMAMQYIDTCSMIANANDYSFNKKTDIMRIKANLLIAMNNLGEALGILLSLENHFKIISITESNNTYNYSNSIIVNSKIGQIYSKQGNYKRALNYLLQGLKLIEHLDKKTDFKIFILTEIASIYKKQHKYDKAFLYLSKAFHNMEKTLGISGKRNKEGLKIRNSYVEKLETKEKELMSKNLMLSNEEKANLRLRLILLIIIAMTLASGLFLWSKIALTRLKTEQKQIHEKAKEKERVSQLEIDHKNRELTNYSLQLLEYDDLLGKFVNYIGDKKDSNAKSLKFARKQLAKNQWEEFEKRFVDIHEGFYERLTQSFPDLTPNDLKLCALVKLNLRGKEISRLIGMTEKSVHTGRYRIRKKLKLETDTSLEGFLSKV